MTDVTITDGLDLSVDMKIRDDSPLAKARLTQLIATGKDLLENFTRPVDAADIRSLALGASAASPNLLSEDVSLTLGAGMNCGLSISKPADKLLFADDGFSPVIPITPNEVWLGVEFDLSANLAAGASANGVGVSVAAATKLACATYTRIAWTTPPVPALRDACATAFANFSIATSAKAIRDQAANTVNVTDVSGSITVAVSLEQPFTFNALGSANLPFNQTASIQPDVSVKLSTALTFDGDFLVRSYKLSDSRVRLGVYKKHGSTLTVSLIGSAGIGGDIGTADVLGALLNAALPAVDVAAAGIVGENAKILNGVVKDGLNRSLSAQMNATCSAALTDEAAVLYEIDLAESDATATDRAIGHALNGDWTQLESLPNVHRIRNIAVETAEKKQSFTINLFGFYNATSTLDYLKSCTILVDDSGQLSITDKLDTARIRASTSPYASDKAKLRQALMEDFLCTATYGVERGKLNLQLTAMQSYLDYDQNMGSAEMRRNFALAYALGLTPPGSLDTLLAATSSFRHAVVTAIVRYDTPALRDIFYRDPTSQTLRSRQEVERQGRDVMCLFLDPSDPTDAARLSVLRNDAAWQQMDEIGNTAAFHSIPYLSHLGPTQLGAVTADWVSIVWWADALSNVAPALDAVITALDDAPIEDPTGDTGLLKARAHLANVLGSVTRKTDAAFVHGWGAAVLFALSGRHGSAEMNMTWNSKTLQFQSSASDAVSHI